MEVKTAKLQDLVADPSNPRAHPRANLDAIRASIARFGQVEPIVVQKGTNRIIGGHGRLAALKEMGVAEAGVVEIEIDDASASALNLALNRTAELATWNQEALGSILDDLRKIDGGLDGIGWSAEEAEAIIAGAVDYSGANAISPDAFPAVDETRETAYRCPSCGYEWGGQVKPEQGAA